MVECTHPIIIGISHGSCISCGHVALIDKFEIRFIDLPARNGKKWYGAFAKCPVCNSQECEFLTEEEVN